MILRGKRNAGTNDYYQSRKVTITKIKKNTEWGRIYHSKIHLFGIRLILG